MSGKVHIRAGAIKSYLEGPGEAVALVRELLTVAQPGAEHTNAYKRGWDGLRRFLHYPSNSFPTGLVHRVRAHLQLNGYQVEINDFDPYTATVLYRSYQPDSVRKCLHGITLRDYQVKTVLYAMKNARMAIQCPTGSGKTEIGAAIVKLIRRPTLWVVHRKELLHQTADRLQERLQVKEGGIGRVGAGEFSPAFLTVGMVQSLMKVTDEKFWDRWQVLIFDEVHHLSAETWFDIGLACRNAWHRFGLSGTIVTGNAVKDLKLEGATGPIYVAAETMNLAEEGFLAKPKIKMIRLPAQYYPTYETVRQAVYPNWRADPLRLKKLGGKLYNETYKRGITENDARNNTVVTTAVDHAMREGDKVLVLCTRIDHGKRLQRKVLDCVDGKCWVGWLHGTEDDSIRQLALKEFRARDSGAILIASTIFDEGVDIPEIDALVLAGAGESFIKSIQRVGRALRPKPDKDFVLIYDFLDGRDPKAKKDYLAKHSDARLTDYKNQGFDTEVVKRLV